jgi:hypothetical protein
VSCWTVSGGQPVTFSEKGPMYCGRWFWRCEKGAPKNRIGLWINCGVRHRSRAAAVAHCKKLNRQKEAAP